MTHFNIFGSQHDMLLWIFLVYMRLIAATVRFCHHSHYYSRYEFPNA